MILTSGPHSVEVDEEIQDDLRGNLDLQARLLYGLIHARWIVTARGLAKMVRLRVSQYRVPTQLHIHTSIA